MSCLQKRQNAYDSGGFIVVLLGLGSITTGINVGRNQSNYLV